MNQTAGNKLDNAISGSAASVREAGEALDQLAERAAAKLDSTAAYVRRYDPGVKLIRIRQVIRRHPASFVAGAAAAGFFFGMAVLTVRELVRTAEPSPQTSLG